VEFARVRLDLGLGHVDRLEPGELARERLAGFVAAAMGVSGSSSSGYVTSTRAPWARAIAIPAALLEQPGTRV